MRNKGKGSPGDGTSIRDVFAGSGFIYGIFFAGRPEPAQGGVSGGMKRFVILRNEMTKNLGQNQISASGQRARNVRLLAGSASIATAPQDDNKSKGVNGKR